MSFSKDLARFALKAEQATNETRKAICMELFGSVIADSPVDTGRFRGNWQASLGAAKTGEIDRIDRKPLGSPPGPEVYGEILNNLGQLGDIVFLANSLPYAEALEYGWSDQANMGMVRRNVSRIQKIVNKAAQENKL